MTENVQFVVTSEGWHSSFEDVSWLLEFLPLSPFQKISIILCLQLSILFFFSAFRFIFSLWQLVILHQTCLTPHYITCITFVTGIDGEQQFKFCQACLDLRHQRTTKNAALSTLHCCPMNFLSLHATLHAVKEKHQDKSQTCPRLLNLQSQKHWVGSQNLHWLYTVIYEMSIKKSFAAVWG